MRLITRHEAALILTALGLFLWLISAPVAGMLLNHPAALRVAFWTLFCSGIALFVLGVSVL
jgi:hypothetical protein